MVNFLSKAQNDTINYSLNSRINGGTGSYAPFLSTANQYDRFVFSPNSLTMWSTLHKEIKSTNRIDYGFGLELDGNASENENRFFAGELYVLGKFHFLNIYVGRKQEVFGNQDVEFSSGGMLWSKNSRPMPEIALESNRYIHVPYTKGYVEVKGGLSHGWFDHSSIDHLLLHHKYGYIRLGGSLPVNISYGIQHVTQWGGKSAKYGTMPITWNNFFRIFLGESGNSTANLSDQHNTLGNHIISQNLGLDMKLNKVCISLYWQSITEDPPAQKFMATLMNSQDGLWGLSAKFPKFNILNHLVLEYLSTTDQSGPWEVLDGVIYGGADNYYRNSLIPNGWSNQGMTLGNPWLTSPKYNKDGSFSTENDVLRLYYFSGQGKIKTIDYRLTLAYSENFGLPKAIYGNPKNQVSWQLETSTSLHYLKNMKISISISGDRGKMYGNNLALILGISYSGFWKYSY